MRMAILIAAFCLAGCASLPKADTTAPSAVVVAFDHAQITPVIVEGMADRDAGRPVEANNPVRIASISKLLMALSALRLVDEGKLDLDADVSLYLGWRLQHPDYPDVPVTLRQLMMHRAGLRDDAGYVIPLGESLRARLEDPRAWFRAAPPGKAPFEYANIGSPVVATVLEAASGERYDRLLERTVFAPLGIRACVNWIGCSREQADTAVVLYRNTGEVARDDAADRPPNCTITVVEGGACTLDGYVPGTNASVFSPQGGVRIGMMDLARIGQAVLRQDRAFWSSLSQRLSGDALADGRNGDQSFFCNYGLHMQLIDHPDSLCLDALFGDRQGWVGHAGEAYGLRSGLWFDSDNQRGFAYFVTQVPDRTAPDEGGFAPEEIALVRRAMEKTAARRE